jgi:hypothetical protein
MPARRGAWAIYEVFNTAGGGQLFIGVISDQQWTRFVEEFGLRWNAWVDPENSPAPACVKADLAGPELLENLVVEAPPFLHHDQAGVTLALMPLERMSAFLPVQIASRKF